MSRNLLKRKTIYELVEEIKTKAKQYYAETDETYKLGEWVN